MLVFYSLLWVFSVNALESAAEFKNPWLVCPTKQYNPKINIQSLTCHPLQLPNPWETILPDYDGLAVFKNQFVITNPDTQLTYFADQVRDADKVFINGHLVGQLGEFPPQFQKAVLYARMYDIPPSVLNPDGINDIVIWVFNDARNGGFVNSKPVIATSDAVDEWEDDNNHLFLFIMAVLFVTGLMHLVNYYFNRHSKANLSYGVFLLIWTAYLWTYSYFALGSGVPINWLFKMNVVLFFGIFVMFPVFILHFFNAKPSLVLKGVMATALLGIPVVLLVPEPGMAYWPLEVVEVLTIPAILAVFFVFKTAIQDKKPYAKLMVAVLVIYIGMGTADIWLDYFQLANPDRDLLLGPWALMLLTLVLTMILAHKNSVIHRQATRDALTGAYRLSEFVERLDDLKTLANLENKVLMVVMLDVDEFKDINDELGHEEGNRILRELIASLRSQLNSRDILGRYGGDEFCLACLLSDESEAVGRIEHLHQSGRQVHLTRKGVDQPVGITMGYHVSSSDVDESGRKMIRLADLQLIQGKVKNKGGITGLQ